MEDERHSLVQQLTDLNPDYKPPSDYKPPQNRITDKVFIPQDSHPEINFVGLLIGPRGNTLKALEKETGAKVIIRGKGSVKEGKLGRRDGLPMPGEDEPLHAFVSAPAAEAVDKAVKRIQEIIRQGIEVPESQNDLRRAQLRELALLNGTLREHEGLMKLRAMAEAQSIATNKIQCGICGGIGHLSTDCKANLDDIRFIEQFNSNPTERAKMDSEYTALMAELGVGPGAMLAGMNRLKAQGARPPKQPPPPGVAPDDDDETETTSSAVNGTHATSMAQSMTSPGGAPPGPYPYGGLPPPPVPPMIPGAPAWPMVMPPMSGYPPVASYAPAPQSTGTGVYTMPPQPPAVATGGDTASTVHWSSVASTQATWGDPAAMAPAYGGAAMVPPYAGAYWGGMYPPVANPPPPPPPPPPPGV